HPPAGRRWAAITTAPIHEIELRIVWAGAPRRAAAAQVSVACRPRLGARLTRRRYGVVTPQLLARFGIEPIEESAYAKFSAGNPGDQDTIGNHRRAGDRKPFFPVCDLALPYLLAGLLIERNAVRVQRAANHLAVV